MKDGNHTLYQLFCQSEPELLTTGIHSLDLPSQDHLLGSTNTGTNFQKSALLTVMALSAVSLRPSLKVYFKTSKVYSLEKKILSLNECNFFSPPLKIFFHYVCVLATFDKSWARGQWDFAMVWHSFAKYWLILTDFPLITFQVLPLNQRIVTVYGVFVSEQISQISTMRRMKGIRANRCKKILFSRYEANVLKDFTKGFCFVFFCTHF